ncbi:hypothetical protein XENOCAPTIV_010518 [Xenoophorus captivus]|uniref:Uncharacterized protein n=1 Tax=Xenoophorus captivus TaxID=1517983 RepID=A0ABV0R4H7_9TELE
MLNSLILTDLLILDAYSDDAQCQNLPETCLAAILQMIQRVKLLITVAAALGLCLSHKYWMNCGMTVLTADALQANEAQIRCFSWQLEWPFSSPNKSELGHFHMWC